MEEQQKAIEATFEELKNKFTVTYDQQQAENVQLQQQLMQAEKLLKEAVSNSEAQGR